MTEYSMRYIESNLGVTVPQAYRQLMTSPEAQEADGRHRGLFDSSVNVVDETLGLRDVAQIEGIPFAKSWVCVSDLEADLILLDTADPDLPLYLWNHETHEVEPFDSFARFISNMK